MQELILQSDLVGSALSAATRTLICLIKLQKDLSEEELSRIEAAFSLDVNSSSSASGQVSSQQQTECRQLEIRGEHLKGDADAEAIKS